MDLSVLVTEEQLQAELIERLRAGRIPEKYFYWSPLAAKSWLALCRSAAYKNYERSMEVLRREADEIARLAPRGACWIGLGCGQGTKDLVVLRSMAAAVSSVDPPLFIALDTSQWLIELALSAAAEAGIPARGLKADLETAGHLLAARMMAAERTAVLALLGNTLGAIDYRRFLGGFGRAMRDGDLFLVDGEIYDERSVAEGYLNEDNHRFAISPLLTLGLTEADGDLVFETVPDPGGSDGLLQLRKHFTLSHDVTLRVAGVPIPLRRGDRLDMGYSCKYAPGALAALLEGPGGMRVERSFTSEDGRFLVAVARRHRV